MLEPSPVAARSVARPPGLKRGVPPGSTAQNRASATLLFAGGGPRDETLVGKKIADTPWAIYATELPPGPRNGEPQGHRILDPVARLARCADLLPRRASTCRGRQATFRLCFSRPNGRRLVPLAAPLADRIKSSWTCSALSLDATRPISSRMRTYEKVGLMYT
jgi:hypothetical protein